jgi:signal peptidase I
MQSIGDLGRFLSSVATLCVIFGVLMRLFFVDVYTMPHNGMAPTLIMGDEVLVWRHAKPDMSDIMLCEHPARPEQTVIGRVVAFPGHTVSTDRFGNLSVDSDRANTETIGTVRFYDESHKRLFMMNLGQIEYNRHRGRQYFVESGTSFSLVTNQLEHGLYLLSDNRSDDYDDSREFGEVKPDNCTRQVFMRLRPAPKQDDDISHSYLELIH